jgi:hypothetical protein
MTFMNKNLTKISIALAAGGLLTAGLAAGAATTASAATGPAWHVVLSTSSGTVSDSFVTVVATGQNSGWAFRSDGAAFERTGATTWKQVAFPGTGGVVSAAGASSPSDVWAAYDVSGETQLYHWNGRSWTLAKSFTSGAIGAISALSPSDVWVSGTAGMFRFNGRTWTEVSATLGLGSALSDSDVWAFNGTDVDHYNGRTWTATSVASLLPAQLAGHPASNVSDVIELAPNNVYATGEGDQTPRGGPGVVLHYNGRSWSLVESGGFVEGGKLASDGAGGLWIEGQSFPGRLPELFHYSAGQVTDTGPVGEPASVSQIPGTREALSGGWESGTGDGTAVVWQYS